MGDRGGYGGGGGQFRYDRYQNNNMGGYGDQGDGGGYGGGGYGGRGGYRGGGGYNRGGGGFRGRGGGGYRGRGGYQGPGEYAHGGQGDGGEDQGFGESRKRMRYYEGGPQQSGDNEDGSPDMKQRRFQNRRGGGGHRQFHMRSEEMEDDDEDVEEDTIESRLEKLIVNIAEDVSTPLEYQLEKLADVLHEDIKRCGGHISKVIVESMLKMPEKLTVYTTLVGLINAKSFAAGAEIIEAHVRHLKDAVRQNEFERSRLLLCGLADLYNCHALSPSYLVTVFNNLVDVSMEDNIPQSRSDWYTYMVMSVLPWAGRELFQTRETDVRQLMISIENYVGKRQKKYLPLLQVWSSDQPHKQLDYMDALWGQLHASWQRDRWQENVLLRPYKAYFSRELRQGKQHTPAQIIPPEHSAETLYPLPWVAFRLFDATDVVDAPPMPPSNSIERYIIEEQLRRILWASWTERRDCARKLLAAFPDNKLPVSYCIVEVMLGQLFMMPNSPQLEICYGSTFMEICKLAPTTFPQVLAQAVEIVFERIDTMNVSCISRFASWFAYHLSQVAFRWSWDEWAEFVQGQDPMGPKPRFLAECFQKMMRLSYHQRLLEIISQDHIELFANVLPAKPQIDYKYDEPNAEQYPGTTHAQDVLAALRQKCSVDEASKLLKDIPIAPGFEAFEIKNYTPLAVNVFVSVLSFVGQKSFSHILAGISKFYPLLLDFAQTDDGQLLMLQTLFDLWHHHQQMLVVVVDKLVKAQIIHYQSIPNWMFSPAMLPELSNGYIWEMLYGIIDGLQCQIQVLQNEFDQLTYDRNEANLKPEPDEAIVKELDEKLSKNSDRFAKLQEELKNLFLIICQRFIKALTETQPGTIPGGEPNAPLTNPYWHRWVTQRCEEFLLRYHSELFKMAPTLEQLLFKPDAGASLYEMFQNYVSLRA